jgi:hypothetical protein
MNYDDYLEAPYQKRYEEEEQRRREIESYDNYEQWREWISSSADISDDFEEYCATFNDLIENFAKTLPTPAEAKVLASRSPEEYWQEWSKWLWDLGDNLLEFFCSNYVDLHKEEFEEWVLN